MSKERPSNRFHEDQEGVPKGPGGKVNCFECQHYFITWDAHSPKGCRVYGFKSHEAPSLVVMRNSGYPCLNFTVKTKMK